MFKKFFLTFYKVPQFYKIPLITFMILMFGTTAMASSYDISYSFLVDLKGQTRYFDGQHIAFESFAESEPAPHSILKTYTVTLYRDKGWWSKPDEIGEVTLLRDTWDKAEWTNVGPGNYFIRLEKANDGITLEDDNAHFYNFEN